MTTCLRRFRFAAAAFAVILLLALAPRPASAVIDCPCWEKLEIGVFSVCYDSPGPSLNTFGYLSPAFGGPLFLQVTNSWCRRNGQFYWLTPEQADFCHVHLMQACFATPAC